MIFKRHISLSLAWLCKFKSKFYYIATHDHIKFSQFKDFHKYSYLMNLDKKEIIKSQSPASDALETNGNKRPMDSEDDEDWVKRIQLDPEPIEQIPVRRKLRKFVLLLSYCGKGYLGMQRNPGFRTIEDDLLVAMLRASLIKEEGVTCPQIYRFQRAARTDKGVSAVRQVVSLKLPDDADIPSAINEHLAEQIKVMKAVRVTQKFDSKTQCDCRSYSYLIPTFAFAPQNEMNEDYTMSPEVLEELQNILLQYRGVHNFHNFTAKVKFTQQCAKRYIMDINCSDPFVKDGIEWTRIKIKGQSFMLHQIRKMVGLAICLCKGYVSKDVFNQVWCADRVDIPIAPGLGLVLEEPHYTYYNRKHCSDGSHEALLWDAEEDKIQAFREKYIDSVIITTEKEEKSMVKWLETLELHSFNRPTKEPQSKKPFMEDEPEEKDLNEEATLSSQSETEIVNTQPSSVDCERSSDNDF